MKKIIYIICLLLILSVISGCVQTPPADTSASEQLTDTPTQANTGNTDGNTTDTASETSAEDNKYSMADFAFNDSESAQNAEFAAAQTGLIARYYSDEAGTKQISILAVDGENIEIDDSRIVKVVKLSGFIKFDDGGKKKLKFSDNVKSTITIGQGDLHVSGYSYSFKFAAGVYYEFNAELKIKEPSEKVTITFGCESDGFLFQLCRPLTGGDMPQGSSPALDIPMRDCQVINVDGTYYMTGTSGPDFWDNSKDIHVYRSEDTVNWEDLGAVWDYGTQATWQKKVANDDRIPFWSPEIHYLKGNFYICYSLGFWGRFCGGLLKSTTGLPQGPYEDVTDSALVDYIDSSMFEDDDGTVYFLYSDGQIAEINDELTGFTEDFRLLCAADGIPVGFEGCYITKINGLYYLTSSLYNTYKNSAGKIVYTSYDCVYAVSDNIYGPYSERRLLMRGGGHGSLFADEEGNMYLTHFITWMKPGITRLSIDDRGVLTTR